jgi:hypothetical protein
MLHLVVSADGSAAALYAEEIDLRSLGDLAIARASRVEPGPSGLWTADLSPCGGPHLGPFPRRSDALAAEAAWILARRLAPGRG